jgi:hypothetical protein
MAHYAYLDENNVVVNVINGKDEDELIDGLEPEIYYALNTPYTVKRTSYNTYGGVHYGDDGSPAFRKNYAGIGYIFDGIGFFAPKPYPSWHFDSETYFWNAPIPYPNDGNLYYWNEEMQEWVLQP